MNPHAPRIIPVLALAAAAAACGGPARDAEAAARLAGAWTLHLHVESALPGPLTEPPDLAGRLVLSPPPPSVARGMDRPAVCPARLTVLPGKLAALLGETGCEARVRAHGGAVELTLGDRGELVLDGRAAGDSLAGRWWYGGRSAGASGRFVLRREAPPSRSSHTER